MDVHRFDAFARTLASGTTRRAFIRHLTRSGAGALAGIAGIGAVRSAAATQPTGSGSGTAGQTGCEPISCPAGRVFSEPDCACVCDVVCRPNFVLDPATCNCYCTLSDFHVCPRPDQVYDDNSCACVCAIEDCPGDAVLDPESCTCFCPSTIVCEPGEQIDPETCECFCDRTCEWPLVVDDCACVCGIEECPPRFIFDETACTCTCERGDCQAPLTLDAETCECICQAGRACASPKLFDEDACDCVCPPEIRCTRGKVVDPETCGCICPPDDPCPAGQVMNPESCLCECGGPVDCTAPKVADPETCACVCPPEEACPAHLTKDPETCRCVCAPGTALCKDECVAPCLPTEAYNDDCRCEPIVCPPDRVLTCTCACPQGMAECEGNCLPACGPNQVFDGGCRCVCRPNISCAEGYTLDPATCECECADRACPAGKVLDRETCACICGPNRPCPVGQTRNPGTCRCECGPEPCPPGRVKNRACRCICDPARACGMGEVVDPATCACRCAPGSLLETIRVPCGGRTVTSATVLQAGVAYTLRASGTCRLGANNTGDAEYAFQTINPANLTHLQDVCVNTGTELGIGINDPTIDGVKPPDWGPYTTTHVYTTVFNGLGATIDLNYHDCFYNDNRGELTVEIFCPGTPVGDPVSTGTGVATPICTNTCPAGKTLDPQSCDCVCPTEACAAPFQRDPATCGCICPPNISCQSGESVDPATCACRCNPGATLETVTVPCSGAAVVSSTSLRAGVTYVLRASGTCTIGYISPPAPDADAEYAFVHSDPTNTSLIMDRCPGASDLGIGIDDATFDGTKTPNWGPYSPTHVYTIGFAGKGAPISVNYHDCVHRDNVGSLRVEIICPGATGGDPVETGEGGASDG